MDQITIASYGNIKVPTVPWLHTEGKYVIDENNQTVYLRGAAMSGLEGYGYPNPAYWHGANFDALLSEPAKVGKRPNVIRIPCVLWEYWPWVTGETFEHDIALMEDAMDYAVNFGIENGVYISLDFHGVKDEHYPLIGEDPTLWIEWMKHWAIRYKDIPNVIYELWNEPWIEGLGDGDLALGQQRWISMVERAYEEISAVHPKALFIVNIDEIVVHDYFIANPLPQNAIYAFGYYYFHLAYDWYRLPYAQGDYELALERLEGWYYGYRKLDADMPMMCKEYGWGNNMHNITQEEPAYDVNMHHVYTLWEENNVHWYEWVWGKSSYGLCNSDWTLRNPTGVIWAEYLNPLT